MATAKKEPTEAAPKAETPADAADDVAAKEDTTEAAPTKAKAPKAPAEPAAPIAHGRNVVS